MTTEFRYDFIKDVSRPNEILVLPPTEIPLSAGVWTTLREDRMDVTRVACLSHVLDLLCVRNPTWERWVIVGHGAMQPRTAVVKRDGIRGYLRRQEIQFSSDEFMEQEHEYEGGVRFVGATQWERFEIEAVNSCMMDDDAVIILAERDIARVFATRAITKEAKAWVVPRRQRSPPLGVLNLAAREPVIVVDVYGEFDDREVAVAAIGRYEFLQTHGVGPEDA